MSESEIRSRFWVIDKDGLSALRPKRPLSGAERLCQPQNSAIEPLGVVSSYIQHDRHRSFRTNATDERVQGKLPDRDAETSGALITDAKNTVTVSHDYDVDVLTRAISQ
jgi:hypothetical protein